MAEGRDLKKEIDSIAKESKKIGMGAGIKFLKDYVLNQDGSELQARAAAIAGENVLYAASQHGFKAAVVPFRALAYARGNNGDFTWCFDGVTMRQYIAFHLGRSTIYGLAITEAENKPAPPEGVRPQGAHAHGNFQEETIFLSDNVTVVSGQGRGADFIPNLSTGQVYNFGDMSSVPVVDGSGIQHQLSNLNGYSTVDFTLKGHIGQLIKTEEGGEADLGIQNPFVQKRGWGSIHSQIYRKNSGVLYAGVRMEGDELVFKDGSIVEEIPTSVQANIYTVKTDQVTEQIPFSPLDGNTQVIRILPWPANLTAVFDTMAGQWLSEDNIGRIRAKVTVIDEHGNEASTVVNGGDVVVLNQSGSELPEKFSGGLSGRIVGYRVENQSQDNLELMFLTMIPIYSDSD